MHIIRSRLIRFSLFCSIVPLISLSAMTEAAEKPNILLLLSDDHSYPYVSCYGNRDVKTPTLDRLASEGIKCHRFFTAAPQCVPSRATLMTGRSPVALRMTRFSSPLPKEEVTLPEWLRDRADYYTGICGRAFHLDGPAAGKTQEIGELINRHNMRTFADRVHSLNTCPDNQVASQFSQFLDQRPSHKPFFMWANFSDPHHAWNAPDDFRPDPKNLTIPGHWPDLPGVREQFADYCGEINRLDQTVAGVLDVLKQRNLMEKTLIVFLGDNGMAFPHGKGSLYDPGSNVPCIIRWPGVVAEGIESRELLSGEDIAPTLLEAAGVQPPERMSGISFMKLLKGEPHSPRQYIFVERGPHGSAAPVEIDVASSSYDLSRTVRGDHYKLIYNGTPWIRYSPVDSAGGDGWTQIKAAQAEGKLSAGHSTTYFSNPRPVYELYNLDDDPPELNNLSGRPEVADIERQLRTALTEKMILDFDYLPLPAIQPGKTASASKRQKK